MQWFAAWRFSADCYVWEVFAAWGSRWTTFLQQARCLKKSIWWWIVHAYWVSRWCSRSFCPPLGRSNHYSRWDSHPSWLLFVCKISEGTSKCTRLYNPNLLFLFGDFQQLTCHLDQVFDSARARERERELLYPDACGGGGRGWISQGMVGYGRGHGTRETCALHTARLSVDTLVDFWSALGEETRLSLLRMKEEDFIERLMYR